MKKTLMLLLATSLIPFLNAATTVSNENGLKTALNGNDKEIILNGSFATSGDLNIPAGYTVTLINNAKITLKYETNSKGQVKTCHNLTGSGTIITGSSTIKTIETRTIECPNPEACPGNFCGKQYDLTQIEKNGGSISYTHESQMGSVKMESSLCVDENEPEISLDINPVAVICNVSKGINGGRTFVKAYGTMADACSAVKTDGTQVVILLEDSSMSGSGDLNKGFVLDCARKTATVKGYSQARNAAQLVYLNAASATCVKLTNANATFINCDSATINGEFNNNDAGNSTSVHVYDCTKLPTIKKFSSNATLSDGKAGVCFFSGGPYPVSGYTTNYKVYGGTFTSDDPTPYLKSSDLEAVPDGSIWKVQKKKPASKAAQIGENQYATLPDAITAASPGATVTLLSDIELADALTISKNLTLDLAGYDVNATQGITITTGAVKFEDRSNYDEPSTLSGSITLTGGSLEITYGTYACNFIIHDSASFTVHHATFDGTIEAAANATLDIRGGCFKNSLKNLLINGYQETLHEGYYWVGQFPWAIVSDASLTNTEKSWTLKAINDADLAIYTSTPAHGSQEWYRKAELTSMLKPYEGYTIDCVVKFDRAVAMESVKIYATAKVSIEKALDRDLGADETYRVLSTAILNSTNPSTGKPYAQISYGRFVIGSDCPTTIKAGLANLSEENAGTKCTIELQLCTGDPSREDRPFTTVYTLASVEYTFPMVYVGNQKYHTLTDAPAGSDVRVLDDTSLVIAAVNEDAKSIDSLELNNHTVTLILPETFDTTKETRLYQWTTRPIDGQFVSNLTRGVLVIKDDGLYYIPTTLTEGTIPENISAAEAQKIEDALIAIAVNNHWTKATAIAQNSAGEERPIETVTLFKNIHTTSETRISEATPTIVLIYDFGITDMTVDHNGNVIFTATVIGPSDEPPADFMEETRIWLLMDGEPVAEMIKTGIGTAVGSFPIPDGNNFTKHFSVIATNEPDATEDQ